MDFIERNNENEEEINNNISLIDYYDYYYNIQYKNNEIVSQYENENETKNINEQNDINYANDILAVFKISEYDGDQIILATSFMYNEISLEPRKITLSTNLGGKMMCDDPEIGFIILFSYDYFYLMHEYIFHLKMKNELKRLEILEKIEQLVNLSTK